MKKLIALTFLVSCLFVTGCQGGSEEKGQPIQQGDYTTEPGGAAKPKTGEGS